MSALKYGFHNYENVRNKPVAQHHSTGFLRLVEEEKGRISELAAHQPEPELIFWPSGSSEYTPICLQLRRVAQRKPSQYTFG